MIEIIGIILLGIWMLLIVVDIWSIKRRLERLEWLIEKKEKRLDRLEWLMEKKLESEAEDGRNN